MTTTDNTLTPKAIAAENVLRLAALADDYDPHRGIGCYGDRIEVSTPVEGLSSARVPLAMVEDPLYQVASGADQWRMLRCRYDFEYWCVNCVRIKPKAGWRMTPFVLNRGQRKVLAALEADRMANRPIRIIVLKARQWGCSTLIQNYMAWIQMCLRPNWHSLICCHNKDSAVNIRRLYTNLVRDYPAALWKPADEADSDGDKQPRLTFKPFEGSTNVREIAGRGCRVAVTSSEAQDAIRGYDIAMAHLSETAFWRDTPTRSPNDLIRSVCGSVGLLPYTLVAMESTANGMGNYFYEEWQRAKAGESDKRPVFVAWFEVETNSLPLDMPPKEFAATLSDRELSLWNLGCTLEQINWYRHKARVDKDIQKLYAEYPSNDTEAFGTSNAGVFDQVDIDRMMKGCRAPERTCSVVDGKIYDRPGGELEIWEEPRAGAVYVVAVDIGGRSRTSDWSVIAVMRRCQSASESRHAIVAQWRGHVDHDILVEIARVIAERYNEALLVIESNTLETEAGSNGAVNCYILDQLATRYSNLYRRRYSEACGQQGGRIGFHTNRATKGMLICELIKAVREGEYAERSAAACYELAVYKQHSNGSFGAKAGYHDDILMTRALAIHTINEASLRSPAPNPIRLNATVW